MDSSIWSDLFTLGEPAPEKVVRTVLVYLGIALIIRFAGKRLMAQMNSLDLVVVLLLSNVVQNAIIGNDNSLTGGLLGAVVLVAVNAAIDRWANTDKRVGRFLIGRPTTVVRDGVFDEKVAARLGLTRHELRVALRHQGADKLSEVERASLEPGGGIAVDLTRQDQNASYGDLRAAVDELRAEIASLRQAGRTTS